MEENKTLAIYSAEWFYGEQGEKQSHTFLVLIDETHGEGPDGKVTEQLHFTDSSFDTMVVEVNKRPISREQFSEIELHKYISGTEEEILPRWNHALAYGQFINPLNIAFEGAATRAPNCVSGVGAAIKVMGLSLTEEFEKSCNSRLMPSFKKYEPPEANVISVTELHKTHDELCNSLVA